MAPPEEKSLLIGKDPDAGKDGRQEEKGTTEDEMVGRHHQLNRPEPERTSGDRTGKTGVLHGLRRVRHDLVTEQQLAAPGLV